MKTKSLPASKTNVTQLGQNSSSGKREARKKIQKLKDLWLHGLVAVVVVVSQSLSAMLLVEAFSWKFQLGARWLGK